MTNLAPHPAYVLIEQRLSAIGRKYRLQRLALGAMRWAMWAIATSMIAAIAAHFLGEGTASAAVAIGWGIWLAASGIIWIAGPMLVKPKNVEVARLIESRVDGLHNGLTNSILLARSADLSSSPFVAPIFDEVLNATHSRSLDEAVTLGDLKRPARRLAAVAVSAAVLLLLFHTQFTQGWQQVIAPRTFVPQKGSIQITDVQPGDVTLVAGQPLEFTALAHNSETTSTATAGAPDGRLVFDGPVAQAALVGSLMEDGQFRYAYRLEHVEQSMRYRLEVGATQSAWFNVTVVPQVKLIAMDFTIIPPSYTAQRAATLKLAVDQIDKQPVVVPQGSVVEIGIQVDVPASGAMLQVGQGKQIEMHADGDPHRFSQSITVMADTAISVGLLEGSQVVAKFPANELTIHCTPDAAPRIEMKWPSPDGVTIAPTRELTIQATVSDDWGLSAARVLVGIGDGPLAVAHEEPVVAEKMRMLVTPIELTAAQCADGQSVHVQVEAVDNRDLRQQMIATGLNGRDDGGPQTAHGPVVEIKFVDSSRLPEQQKQAADKLRARLTEILKTQEGLLDQAAAFKGDKSAMGKINAGQSDLRNLLIDTAEKFEFEQAQMIVKRTLQELAVNPAKDAIDLSAAIASEPLERAQIRMNVQLRASQQHIISTLESLLGMLNPSEQPAKPSGPGSDPLASQADAFKKLQENLQHYIKQQQKVMDQTASLAKTPVQDFTQGDQKTAEELKMAQENLDAFMQQAVSDFSKNAPQDMSNSDMLKDLLAIQSEVTMAKGALKDKAMELAVAAEENGVDDAKAAQGELEKWLGNKPDRTQMSMEDPVLRTDTPLGALPKDMEDMVGKLMEQQEDLFKQMEDANANLQTSAQKQGWDAADGPIADYSAKGVTGNVLPNNNEQQGRSGEGRSGQSEGQFVGDSAVGKGGRDTPTRLDPTPFEKGQVHDTSKDPTGGATGGGKLSGEGGQGLQGPLAPQLRQEMQRLAQKQAELRNTAERLNLKYQLARYDNFKLLQSIGQMRRVESDLKANRYQNALLRRDVLIDSLATSKMLLGGRMHVDLDTSPVPSGKTQQDINDAMKGELPPAWADALKEYYQKLSQQ